MDKGDVELLDIHDLPDSPFKDSEHVFPVSLPGNEHLKNKYILLEKTTTDTNVSIRRLRCFCVFLSVLVLLIGCGTGYVTYQLITRMGSAEDKIASVQSHLNTIQSSSLDQNTMGITAHSLSLTDVSNRIQKLNDTLSSKEDISQRNIQFLKNEVENIDRHMLNRYEETKLHFGRLETKANWLIDNFLSITENSLESYEELSVDLKSQNNAVLIYGLVVNSSEQTNNKSTEEGHYQTDDFQRDNFSVNVDYIPFEENGSNTSRHARSPNSSAEIESSIVTANETFYSETDEDTDYSGDVLISEDTTRKNIFRNIDKERTTELFDGRTLEKKTVEESYNETVENNFNKLTTETYYTTVEDHLNQSEQSESDKENTTDLFDGRTREKETVKESYNKTTKNNFSKITTETYYTTVKDYLKQTEQSESANGDWTEWSSWSKCSASCGTGQMMRIRTCEEQNSNYGHRHCEGGNIEERRCRAISCPVHGKWSTWASWSACSSSCGAGMKKRERSCSNPRPSILGNACDGDSSEYETCMVKSCKVDGGWSSWSSWTPCSSTCGDGMRHRLRTCTNPRPSGFGDRCEGVSQEYDICKTSSCPVDGQWSEWSIWSSCSVTCGRGESTRLRSCSNPSLSGAGANCIGNSTEFTMCDAIDCSVHGGWSSWSIWTSCSATCGDGMRQRLRTCTNPRPSGLGDRCEGGSQEYDICKRSSCPVDGQWSEWSIWSSCSVTCGRGESTRLRSCSNPSPSGAGENCLGNSTEFTRCDAIACSVNATWSMWSSWSRCSKTCGQGVVQRKRSCDYPVHSILGEHCIGNSVEYDVCQSNACAVNGQWSDWSMWSGCGVTCGSGHKTRLRTCTNPAPVGSGANCVGTSTETSTCKVIGCPVNGVWSMWSSWSSCSKTCGQGVEHRTRDCTHPVLSILGENCIGKSVEYDVCQTNVCAINGQWSTWSSWSACSVTCGSGQKTRLRTCTNPVQIGSEAICHGRDVESSNCNVIECPVNGDWANWSSWSTCDAACGVGTSFRKRSCTSPSPSNTGNFCFGEPIQYRSCHTTHAEGEIRLSQSSTAGRVEICYHGQWGTVCDDGWDNNDATVACKMLGRSSGTAHGSAYYGEGTGQIVLDDVACTGSEGSLLQCNHRGPGQHNCGHGEDAGVVCS